MFLHFLGHAGSFISVSDGIAPASIAAICSGLAPTMVLVSALPLIVAGGPIGALPAAPARPLAVPGSPVYAARDRRHMAGIPPRPRNMPANPAIAPGWAIGMPQGPAVASI